MFNAETVTILLTYIYNAVNSIINVAVKYSHLKAIFASEQTERGLLVIGLDNEGRQVEVLFQITTEPKTDWEAVNIRYL